MPVRLPSSLTLPQASAVLAQVRQSLLERGPTGSSVVVDASGLQQLDSSSIAVLLQCRRDAQAQGLGLVLESPPDKLMALMRLYGVAELFTGAAGDAGVNAP